MALKIVIWLKGFIVGFYIHCHTSSRFICALGWPDSFFPLETLDTLK